MLQEEATIIANSTIDLFEALLKEDYSYSGDDRLSAEEEVNLFASRSTIEKASKTESIGDFLFTINLETEENRASSARNVELGPVKLSPSTQKVSLNCQLISLNRQVEEVKAELKELG